MLALSERCKNLRADAVDGKRYNDLITPQRDFYYFKGISEAPEDRRTNDYLSASGVASVIRGFPAIIGDDELIVGRNFGDYERVSGDPETARKQLLGGGFSEREIESFFEFREDARRIYKRIAPEPIADDKDKALVEEMAAMGSVVTNNHTVLDYEKVLKLGFSGIAKEVKKYAERNGGGSLYDAMLLLCEAGSDLGRRYAVKARELAESGRFSDARVKELMEIERICLRVPEHPAESFAEAVQSLWFAHMINTYEDCVNANSLGRLDQILYPYYRADIEKGVLTERDAFELICCLWIKLYRDYDVQQSCVGGCDASGQNAVNALSWLMLDATEALDFVRCLSVRFSEATPRDFIRRALQVVGRCKKGVPFFFNDDVMIPSLVSRGISLEDARGYTQIGCVETVIPGKSNPHAVSLRCNVLKAVEYVLKNGRSMLRPELSPGLETGDPLSLDTFERFKAAVYEQIGFMLERACRMTLRCLDASAVNEPLPYKAMLTEGCMESGKGFNSRSAKYDYYQFMLFGIPNLADSLAAVNELIYIKKRYTLSELISALENNFPDEAMRLDFVNKAPKYGNDLPAVDAIAAEITDFCCDVLDRISEECGVAFHAQPFTFLWMIDHGLKTAATPDGRRNGEILAYSVSPMQGRDFRGLTALFNSVSSLPTRRTPGTTSAIIEVDPLLFNDGNIGRLADILVAAAKKGLSNVQFNITDAETLIDAQRHPDRHRNLAVRVSGFSQKFCLLDEKLQNHIIARTKHRSI
jgi:pyruvate-formate lyase